MSADHLCIWSICRFMKPDTFFSNRLARDTFGASIGLWWTGESILDLAPYIDDARSMSMQLLGGNTGASSPYGFHDWNYILSELDILKHDHLLSDIAATGGKLIMSLSLIWGAVLLVRQFSRLKGRSG